MFSMFSKLKKEKEIINLDLSEEEIKKYINFRFGELCGATVIKELPKKTDPTQVYIKSSSKDKFLLFEYYVTVMDEWVKLGDSVIAFF